jgi:hypothetical protein
MDDQRIIVETCQISMVMVNGLRIHGETFLQLQGVYLTGPQRVGELLNGDETFLPVRDGSKVQLVNLEQVVSVSLSAELEFDPLLTLGEEHRVWVEPVAGDTIEARIFVNLPGNKSRVKDFLNQKVRFLPFLDNDRVVYFARKRILRVTD